MKIRLILSAFGWQSSQPKKIRYRAALPPSRIATAGTLVLVAAGLVCVAANPNRSGPPKLGLHHHYKFIDLGTLGGPNSYFSAGGNGTTILNNRGTVAGYGDTSAPDPYAPNCFDLDCFLAHTFRWQDGTLTDLGALPGSNSSAASGINARGSITGYSQNGVIDPLTGSPENVAVLWKDSQIINLGTLGGNESVGIAVNNRGLVTGFATNSIPDPLDPFGYGTQLRTFVWQNGMMRDLGTLGGPDSPPFGNIGINESGQIAGSSFTNSTPNPVTGLPTTDPFLWEKGTITDLGTLGGTLGFPFSMNSRGQVVGLSNLAGDLTAHPFLWNQGRMTDLGTLGGTYGEAIWINDAGEVVGGATTQDESFHATLWKEAKVTDLGTIESDGCSEGLAVNSGGQIVGVSFACDFSSAQAFLWENGSIIDLNTLIPPNSSLHLVFAGNINDRGEIVGAGVPPGHPPDTDLFGRLFLLIPCDENHPGIEGCDYSLVDASAAPSSHPTVAEAARRMPPASLYRRNNRFHFPAFGPRTNR